MEQSTTLLLHIRCIVANHICTMQFDNIDDMRLHTFRLGLGFAASATTSAWLHWRRVTLADSECTDDGMHTHFCYSVLTLARARLAFGLPGPRLGFFHQLWRKSKFRGSVSIHTRSCADQTSELLNTRAISVFRSNAKLQSYCGGGARKNQTDMNLRQTWCARSNRKPNDTCRWHCLEYASFTFLTTTLMVPSTVVPNRPNSQPDDLVVVRNTYFDKSGYLRFIY